ncbi:MAG: DUF6067 family protein [Candidatus Marinimicrobia bacterium]|nr:DUF6067 family protein [Candidatus Neomarinimicrobiota bacterium]
MKTALHTLSIGTALIWMLVGAQAAAAAEAEDAPPYRYLTISLPKLAQEPVIDGAIDPHMLEQAAMGPRFTIPGRDDAPEDRLTSARMQTYFSYTGRGLYLAWRMERPDGYERPVATVLAREGAAQGGVGSLWRSDDIFELQIDAVKANPDARDYYFMWNFAGTRWGRMMYPQVLQPWLPEWQVASNEAYEPGWEGEAFFPFDIFPDVDPPASGEAWRVFFFHNRLTPYPRLELFSWPYGRPAHTTRDYARLIFAPADGVYTRIVDSGLLADRPGASGLLFELVNPADAERRVTLQADLYRRKDDAPAGTSYLREFEQTRDKPGTAQAGVIDLYIPDDQLSAQIRAEYYDVVQTIHETVTLAPGARLARELVTESTEPAQYLVIHEVRCADTGRLIAGAPLQYEVPDPMAVKTTLLPLVSRRLDVEVDLRYVPGFREPGVLSATLSGPGGTVFEQQWPAISNDTRTQRFSIPLADTPPGPQTLRVVAANAAGQTLIARERTIELPETPDWFRDPVAAAPFIPEPWTPIALDGRRLSLLMGSYTFAEGPFPESIDVQAIEEAAEKSLTRRAPALRGRADHAELAWEPASFDMQREHEGRVVITTESFANNLALRGRTTVEYDGFIRFDLTLAPRNPDEPVDLEALFFEIPMQPEFSRLYSRGKVMDGPDGFLVAGEVPAEGLRHPWTNTSWIGNEQRGLIWFAENVKGWRLDPASRDEAIELAPGAAGADLRIHLVKGQAPLRLDAPREITFGIMFTPPSPLYPELIRKYQRNVAAFTEPISDEQFAAREKRMEQEARVNTFCFFDYFGVQPKGWPEMTDPEQIAQHRRRGDIIHALGGRVIAYAGWWMPRDAAVFQDFGMEMIAQPITPGGLNTLYCCYNTPYTEIWTHLWKQRIHDTGVDGYRLDASFEPTRCASLEHRGHGSECGWIDDDGKVQPSYGMFAAREASKRTYSLFHGLERKGGLCGHHHNFGLPDPRASHCDFFLNVEGPERVVLTLRDWPLAYWRARVMSEQHGTWVIYAGKIPNLGYNSIYGLALLHNTIPRSLPGNVLYAGSNYGRGLSPGTVANVWKSLEWFEAHQPRQRQLLGYWNNEHVVRSSEPDSVKITLVNRPGQKLLLTALNLDRQARRARVTLDLDALGFGGETVHVMDIVEPWRPLVLEDGALDLTFLPEGYRYLALSREPFSPEDALPDIPRPVGENLFAAPRAADWNLAALPHRGSVAGPAQVGPEGLRLESGGDDGETLLSFNLDAEPGRDYLLTAHVRLEPRNPPYCSVNVRQGLRLQILETEAPGGHARFQELGSQYLEGESYPLTLLFRCEGAGARVLFRLTGETAAVIEGLDFREVAW